MENYLAQIEPAAQSLLDHVLSCSAIGTVEEVAAQLQAFITRTGADELMLTSNMYDHEARKRSYELTAQAYGLINQ